MPVHFSSTAARLHVYCHVLLRSDEPGHKLWLTALLAEQSDQQELANVEDRTYMYSPEAGHSPPRIPNRAAQSRRLLGWMGLYFLLAGCLFVVLAASLYFDSRIDRVQANAMRFNRTWAQRSHRYAEVGRLAAEVNMPGNDVFESGDPDVESANLRGALQRFDQAVTDARADLTANVTEHDALSLLDGLESVNIYVRKMAAEADAVFAAFKTANNEAGERMAAMDRQGKAVRNAIYTLEQYVSQIEERAFDGQERETVVLMNWQYGLDGLIAFLAVGVVAYAVTLSRQIAVAARNVERNMLLLQESEDALRRETAAAAQANRAKSNFLANMSHEIRTPMTAIMGYAELLLDPEYAESERQDALQVIRRSARHLLELINDVLDISKIEADRMNVEHIPTDIPQIVADVASFMRPSAIAKGLDFKVTIGDSVPRVIYSDPIRVKQVLVNLVGNALKFTQRGEIRIHLSSVLQNDACIVVFEVTDSGIGITDEQILRVFEPFTQADESTTRRFGGTGLGLTISKRLVELLGGELTVKSLPGVGSVFRFTIDGGSTDSVEMTQASSESLLVASPDKSDKKRIVLRGRILLAEDGPDNQRLIAGHLRKAGAEVVVAANGRIAVDMVNSQDFDLILMDMQMPELDGYAATRELRRAGCTLPVVALTAHAMTEDREKCLKVGCTDYLTKPIEKYALLSAVAAFLPQAETFELDDHRSSAPSNDSAPSQTITSSLANDRDMTDAIAEFVAMLPQRISSICEFLNDEKLTDVRRLLHQLKGAGGGFGFDGITCLSAEAEQSLKDEECLVNVRAKVDSVITFVRSIEGYQQIDEGKPWLIQS
jgi:signal transduction histidine kinase/DNA-binding NarL/FixJ family response regulator